MNTGRWVWSESHTDVEYTNWKPPGEPSQGVGEDCGFKAVGAGAGWHDQPSHHKNKKQQGRIPSTMKGPKHVNYCAAEYSFQFIQKLYFFNILQ